MIEFKLPELGENIEQGDLVRLMIAPGANIAEGQPVMELETDKAVVEVPSSVSGTVKDIRVKEGEKVKVGQVIFTVENGTGAKAKTSETKVAESKSKPAQPKTSEQKPAEAPQPQVERRKRQVGHQAHARRRRKWPGRRRRNHDPVGLLRQRVVRAGEHLQRPGDVQHLAARKGEHQDCARLIHAAQPSRRRRWPEGHLQVILGQGA